MNNHSTNPLPIQCHLTATVQSLSQGTTTPDNQWITTQPIHCQSSATVLPLSQMTTPQVYLTTNGNPLHQSIANPVPSDCHCITTQQRDYKSSIPDYHRTPTWLPLYATWTTELQLQCHLITTCLLLDYHLMTTWLPLDYHLTTTWLQLDYHLTTTWVPLEYHLTSTWLPLDYHLTTSWLQLEERKRKGLNWGLWLVES